METIIQFAENYDLISITKLSKDFEIENCCNGIKADDESYFANKNVVVAKMGKQIIGYCYGSVEEKKKTTSCFKKGQKSFYIEEIYISPNYRNQNIGTKLLQFLEDYAKSLGCEILETTAVSKDYKKLLDFYINKMEMKFWSANLIKKI